MISLNEGVKKGFYKKVERFLETSEKVRSARMSLEKATEESFQGYDEAKRRTSQRARYILLD